MSCKCINKLDQRAKTRIFLNLINLTQLTQLGHQIAAWLERSSLSRDLFFSVESRPSSMHHLIIRCTDWNIRCGWTCMKGTPTTVENQQTTYLLWTLWTCRSFSLRGSLEAGFSGFSESKPCHTPSMGLGFGVHGKGRPVPFNGRLYLKDSMNSPQDKLHSNGIPFFWNDPIQMIITDNSMILTECGNRKLLWPSAAPESLEDEDTIEGG